MMPEDSYPRHDDCDDVPLGFADVQDAWGRPILVSVVDVVLIEGARDAHDRNGDLTQRGAVTAYRKVTLTGGVVCFLADTPTLLAQLGATKLRSA